MLFVFLGFVEQFHFTHHKWTSVVYHPTRTNWCWHQQRLIWSLWLLYFRYLWSKFNFRFLWFTVPIFSFLIVKLNYVRLKNFVQTKLCF